MRAGQFSMHSRAPGPRSILHSSKADPSSVLAPRQEFAAVHPHRFGRASAKVRRSFLPRSERALRRLGYPKPEWLDAAYYAEKIVGMDKQVARADRAGQENTLRDQK